MVSWVGDGRMAGFDPTTNQLEPDLYHFASPGSVDINAVTRLDYDLPPGADRDEYPNRLNLSATFNFVAADFTEHPGRWLVAGAFLAAADQFASGVTPTPQQILNLGYGNLGWTYSDQETVQPGNKAFTIRGWGAESLTRGKKYWMLLIPCYFNDNLTVPIRPMKNINTNTMGRVLSFWTNRTPAKPTITSPADGTTVAAGSIIDFAYTPNDPDSVGSTDRYDRDLAGVQVAYAALPTQEEPSPQFRHLIFKRGDTGGLSETSVYMNQADVTPGDSRIKMLNDLGFPIEFGTGEIPELSNAAALPAGSWQVKVRTADFGYPYPKLANNPATKYPGDWSMNVVPEVNLSPWSDVIKVHVFQQVPPPTPLTPKDAIAIPETRTTRLAWLYRNTFDPPYDQYDRTVQIRHVGEPDWHTIYDAQVSGDTYVDLPPGFTMDVPPDPIPAPTEIQTDGGFESGGVGNWESLDVTLTVENVAGTAGSGVHTGVRALRLDGTESIIGGYTYLSDSIPDEFNAIDISTWVRVNADLACLITSIGWVDVSGNPTGSVESGMKGSWSVGNPSPAVRALLGASLPPLLPGGDDEAWTSSEWIEVDYPRLHRPPDGDRISVAISAVSADPGVVTPADWHRLDDFSTIGRYVDPGYSSLTLEATNEYEWRVKVSDDSFTADSHSEYSAPARFWIVPGNGTGNVKPVPENTTEGATLGCGTHRVFVYRRGAKERVGEITGLSHVDWARVRDDISTAKIVVSNWDIDCGNLLAKLQTWAYEIVIIRDNGYSKDRVWEGPITLLTYERDAVTIQAKDVMGYAYRRIIKQKMDDTDSGDTVVSRAARVIQNVFAPDDPNILAYLMLIQNSTDSKQYRSIPAYSRTAFEEIDDMAANSGLDYTAVGRSILLWGTKSRIGTLPEFRDKDLGASPVVSEYGMSMANVYSVSDGNGIHGEATRLNTDDEDPIYGLVEMLSSTWASDSPEDSGTYSQEGIATIIESFKEYAERSISDRYPPPVVVRIPDNTTLNPSTVLSIQQLVPGVVVPLRSTGTLRTVVADQKLDSVSVTEESGKETITITLSPFSYDDAAPEGGGEV